MDACSSRAFLSGPSPARLTHSELFDEPAIARFWRFVLGNPAHDVEVVAGVHIPHKLLNKGIPTDCHVLVADPSHTRTKNGRDCFLAQPPKANQNALPFVK
jgi:hypothetical protein